MHHSLEIWGLCLMKWPSETLKNLPYFWNTKIQVVFSLKSFWIFRKLEKLAKNMIIFQFSLHFFPFHIQNCFLGKEKCLHLIYIIKVLYEKKIFYLSLKVLFDQITKCILLLDYIPQKFFNMSESRRMPTPYSIDSELGLGD